MKPWTAARCGLGVAVMALSGASPARGQSAAEEALARGGVEIGAAISLSIAKEEGDDESTTAVNVPLRVGVMVVDRLELELEALVSYVDFFDDGETGVIGAAHLLYHFGSGNTVPYLLVGGGYGNAVEFFGIAGKMDDNFAVLRAGAGVKAFIGRHCSLRIEYRFTQYRGEEEGVFLPAQGIDAPSPDIRINDHKVQVGISLWL
jgi:opacity protein-like surface antigen